MTLNMTNVSVHCDAVLIHPWIDSEMLRCLFNWCMRILNIITAKWAEQLVVYVSLLSNMALKSHVFTLPIKELEAIFER